ncbi:type II secretion system F family protein [Streptomyces sp. NPDC058473]|uniref:type II secretion system F family protein n=1 Tax=Streptomyces sp. NPDC058473 TaxID=3346517 RepID=UPI003667A3C9
MWDTAAVLWLVLTALAARRERTARRRAGRALYVERPPTRRRTPSPAPDLVRRTRAREWLLMAGTASAAYALVGGVPGLLTGAAVGYGTWRRNQRSRASPLDPDDENAKAEAARQLPLAADLLAACVAAGASPVAAAHAVGESLRGPIGTRLACGAAEMRLGGEPSDAWRQLAAIPDAAPLARLLERSGETGAPAAAPVARLAADARAQRSRTATAGARRAAVLMTAPVGLCFLPAFVAVGVLPVVIGMAEGLLRAG